MSEILVITCPSGKQCSRLIPLVYNKGHFTLRLAAHSSASAASLRTLYPLAEIVQTDLQSPQSCRALLHNATAINAVLPSLHSGEKQMGINLVDAAVAETKRPGNVFKHFVFSSVLCTQHRSLLQHDLKSFVEEAIFLSPLTCWTILKPTNFMNTYPITLLQQMETPILQKWWNPNHKNSLLNLEDFAAATHKVLLERNPHYYAEYPLCSTLPISESEIMAIISAKLGKEVRVQVPEFKEGVERLSGVLFADGKAAEGDQREDLVQDTVERLILFYNRRGLQGSPNVLRWLLGRETTGVDEWVDACLAASDEEKGKGKVMVNGGG